MPGHEFKNQGELGTVGSEAEGEPPMNPGCPSTSQERGDHSWEVQIVENNKKCPCPEVRHSLSPQNPPALQDFCSGC